MARSSPLRNQFTEPLERFDAAVAFLPDLHRVHVMPLFCAAIDNPDGTPAMNLLDAVMDVDLLPQRLYREKFLFFWWYCHDREILSTGSYCVHVTGTSTNLYQLMLI